MVGVLFDTNILIDLLQALPAAREEIAKHSPQAISLVTWMEVLVGANESKDAATRGFLRRFSIIQIDEPVAHRAIQLRRKYRIKLPDASFGRRRKCIPCYS